jgi:hypothetical protein
MKYNPGKEKKEDIEVMVWEWVIENILNDPMRSTFVKSTEIRENVETEYSDEIVNHILPHIEWLEEWGSSGGSTRYQIIEDRIP